MNDFVLVRHMPKLCTHKPWIYLKITCPFPTLLRDNMQRKRSCCLTCRALLFSICLLTPALRSSHEDGLRVGWWEHLQWQTSRSHRHAIVPRNSSGNFQTFISRWARWNTLLWVSPDGYLGNINVIAFILLCTTLHKCILRSTIKLHHTAWILIKQDKSYYNK